MKMEKVKEVAKKLDLKTGNMKKSELIRTIQRAEGNEACFDSGRSGQCDQDQCAWKEDCR